MSEDDYDLWGNAVGTDSMGFSQGPGIMRTHPASKCAGEFCCIHNPSPHGMRDWPMMWRADRYLMERICPHGVGHPDPDDLAHKHRIMDQVEYDKFAFGVHGCDGCCFKATA